MRDCRIYSFPISDPIDGPLPDRRERGSTYRRFVGFELWTEEDEDHVSCLKNPLG